MRRRGNGERSNESQRYEYNRVGCENNVWKDKDTGKDWPKHNTELEKSGCWMPMPIVRYLCRVADKATPDGNRRG
jgi:hypothetical protein